MHDLLHTALRFIIGALDDLFVVGIFGTIIVLFLTLIEDLKTMFLD